MNFDPSVSVIVATFNRAHYIEECLESLLAQSIPALEILVIDDGSEDDTASRVARYGEAVRYMYKSNGGKPSAVNLGLSLARGEWVWVFDDDDVALPDAIEQRLRVLESSPDAGFVYGPHYFGVDGRDRRIVCGSLNPTRTFPPERFFLEIMKSCFFSLCTSLVRAEHWRSLSGFDPQLLSGEDYDFQIRLARVTKPTYCAIPTVIVRVHDGARGAREVRHEASERSKIFRQYSGRVGRKLRRSVALGEFLVPARTGELAPALCKEALLNRLHVMANLGCIPEMFEDLHEFLSLSSDTCPVSQVESAAIVQAMSAGWAIDAAMFDWRAFRRLAGGIGSRAGGRHILRAMAKGLIRVARSFPAPLPARAERLLRAFQIALLSLR